MIEPITKESMFFLEPEYDTFLSLIQGPYILDLGCGKGRDSAIFAERGFKPLCLDLSDEMLYACENKGLSTLQMDIEDLKLPKERFDGVWSYLALNTIPKSKTWLALSAVHEALKQDGVLFLGLIETTKDGAICYKIEEVLDKLEDSWRVKEYSTISAEITGQDTYLHFVLQK